MITIAHHCLVQSALPSGSRLSFAFAPPSYLPAPYGLSTQHETTRASNMIHLGTHIVQYEVLLHIALYPSLTITTKHRQRVTAITW